MSPFDPDSIHYRMLWLIYGYPDGISAHDLVEELKRRGWAEPDLTPADLGLEPEDVVRKPRRATNDNQD